MEKPAAGEEMETQGAAAPVAADGEVAFPWGPDDRKTYPGSEERRENWKKHYASLQKKYAESCGLEQSQTLEGTNDEMATLSEANVLQQEAGEEEDPTTDEVVHSKEAHVQAEAPVEEGLAIKPESEEGLEANTAKEKKAQEERAGDKQESAKAKPAGDQRGPAGNQRKATAQAPGNRHKPGAKPAEKKRKLEKKPASKKTQNRSPEEPKVVQKQSEKKEIQLVANRPASKMETDLEAAAKRKKGPGTKQENEKAKPARQEEQQTGKDGTFGELTAGQLVKHDAYHEAVRGLKEGHLTEEKFLAMFSHQQRQGMFKLMESSRSESMAAQWKAIRGPGTKETRETNEPECNAHKGTKK